MLVDKVSKLTIMSNEKEYMASLPYGMRVQSRRKVEIERSRDDKCSNTR